MSKNIDARQKMRAKTFWKALICSAFLFFCGCSVSVSQFAPQELQNQAEKWQSITLRGDATLWEDGKKLRQKFFLKKQDSSLQMLCYGGGVAGFTPTPTLSVQVTGSQVSYRTKTVNGQLTPDDKQTKSLYALIYALANLQQIYQTRQMSIGKAAITLDNLGNPSKISCGGVVLQLQYNDSQLSGLEMFFGFRKVLQASFPN